MRNLQALFTATAVGFCLLPTPAHAVPVTFAFSGTVYSVGPAQAGVVEVLDLFTAALTFDSDLPDLAPEDSVGFYAPLSAVRFSAGPYTGVVSEGAITIQNWEPGDPRVDEFAVWARIVGASFGAFEPDFFRLSALGRDMLSSDALLVPGIFEGGFLSLGFTDPTTQRFSDISAGIDSIEPIPNAAPVPEPATLTLVAMGLLGVRWRRARRGR